MIIVFLPLRVKEVSENVIILNALKSCLLVYLLT